VSGSRLLRAVAAQARMELILTLRRGESVLVTLVIPLALLVFFGSVNILPVAARRIDFLLTGTIALSIVSTALVSLGIATAYERYYGVLKQLGATPLPRAGLVAAKMAGVIALEAVQVVLLCGLAALLFGWRPSGSPGLALLAILLGTLCFAGLGLAMAGALRAEATLGAANGLFLFFLLLGGLYVPLSSLPGWMAWTARALPAAPLAETLRSAAHGTVMWSTLAVLVAWAIATPLVAARVFRWE
jgi:ABC-2 type transport system permease protein